MGIISSKSPLERRNTVARRSQRRILHNVKSKVENLHKNIRKFKGVSEDDQQYAALKNDTEYLKNDLTRRAKDLQPQVRNLYENIYKRINEANEALENKLQENKKQYNKESENEQNKVENDDADNIKLKALTPPSTPLLNEIVQNDDHRRKTVEIKLVKVENQPPETAAKEVRIISPAEKRKSILKVGIPVMPVAIQNEFTHRQENVSNKISDIIKHLGQIEQEIHEFVGQKNGKQYNRFNDILNGFLTELNHMNPTDEEVLDQMRACRNYVGSCLSFLNEKATEIDHNNKAESFSSGDDDEEVFESNNNITLMQKLDHNLKLQKMLKNTPV